MSAMELLKRKCVPCEGGEPPLKQEQITEMLTQVPKWRVETVNGHPVLTKTFPCKDFVGSIVFVNKVKDVAEAEGHHPDLKIHWNKVRVENWTHAIGGLHENDFILAAKIDRLSAGTWFPSSPDLVGGGEGRRLKAEGRRETGGKNRRRSCFATRTVLTRSISACILLFHVF